MTIEWETVKPNGDKIQHSMSINLDDDCYACGSPGDNGVKLSEIEEGLKALDCAARIMGEVSQSLSSLDDKLPYHRHKQALADMRRELKSLYFTATAGVEFKQA